MDLTTGPFEKTFSDLVRATRGREDLDLGLLLNKISEEAAKGPAVFEAFGLKFPAEQVSEWGIIVLLSVQLYLVLYLKKLSNKLETDAAGWDVPWIAMDQSGGAQMVVFVTFVGLPFVAALFTIGQFTWLSFLTTISSLFASTLLCGLSWVYRPKPKKPVEPAVTLYW